MSKQTRTKTVVKERAPYVIVLGREGKCQLYYANEVAERLPHDRVRLTDDAATDDEAESRWASLSPRNN